MESKEKKDKLPHSRNKLNSIESAADREQSILSARIESLIHLIRGQHVMFDSDIARLYGVETKALNQAVKRNIGRFPDDFMFKLTKEECLRSQNVTSNKGRGGTRYATNVFTENGVAMLSSVLRSEKAIEVNIKIMRAFSAMRKFLMNNALLFQRMDQLELKQMQTDERVDAILNQLDNSEKVKEGVFFNGQIFDSHVLISNLIKQAEHRIVLIDNYIDETVLIQLSKRKENIPVDIYVGRVSRQLRLDVERHNAQYPGVVLHHYAKAHNRFLIIDDEVYHIGASLKDLGKKLFAFSKMEVMTGNELLSRL